MFLDVGPLNVNGPVESLLSMQSTHICALPSFFLDRIPGFFGGPSSYDTQASGIRAVKGDMTSGKLVSEDPLVKGRSS